MKLDVNVLKYLTKEEWRVLSAVELGQRNHELVPRELVTTIANLKHGGSESYLSNLLKYKLLHKESRKYEGYRLTYLGYDFLAIHALVKQGAISSVGRQIGVGKESDVFEVLNDEGEVMALKMHRLGRTSFRAVKSKRDYLQHRTSFSWLYLSCLAAINDELCSICYDQIAVQGLLWLYLSRLAAIKEYAFMVALGEHGLPVPYAVAQNRHAVLMSLVDAVPLVQVHELANPGAVYEECMNLMTRLAQLGLVHCDFNEFNLLVDDDDNVTLIDFPQMVSVSHENGKELFDRDMECIIRFFKKKLGYLPEDDDLLTCVRPDFEAIIAEGGTGEGLDQELSASGFQHQHQQVLQQFIRQDGYNGTDSASCSSSSEAGEATPDDEDEPQEQKQGGASRPGTAAHVGPHVTDRLQAASLAEADTHQETDPAGRAEPGLQQQGGDEPGGHSLGDQQAAGGGDVQDAESPPDHVVLRQVQAARGSEAAGSSPTPAQAPDPRQVQHTIMEQRRRAVQHKVVARAGRNAQKSGNKRERQQMKASLQFAA